VLPLRVSILGCLAGLLVALVGLWLMVSASSSSSAGLLLLTIGAFDAIAFGAMAVVVAVQRRGRAG
jgi:hypothetical protein